MEVLLTGSSGYIGREILSKLGSIYKVTTLGRGNCDIQVDLSFEEPIFSNSFDRVIHNAGLAHILNKDSSNYEEKMFATNYEGTVRLLNALSKSDKLPKEFVLISTVAVYGLTVADFVDESFPLLANDAYGKSKIFAEEKVMEWGNSNNVSITILRLPLVVGKNPPGNLGKMVNGIKKYKYMSIGEASAKKSMVVVDDISNLLSSISISSGIFNVTDGYHPSFKELETVLAKKHKVLFIIKLPTIIAKFLAMVGDFLGKLNINGFPINSNIVNKITSQLTFSDENARKNLGWKSQKVLEYYQND